MKFIAYLFLFMTFSCNKTNEKSYPLSISQCDSLLTNEMFHKNYNENKVFKKKPNSIREAIHLLDQYLNNDAKRAILICDESKLYFNLSLKIRNNWVRSGTNKFRIELRQSMQLKHVDYTSGFILKLFKYYLSNSKDIISYFKLNSNNKELESVIKHLLEIDKQLKEK